MFYECKLAFASANEIPSGSMQSDWKLIRLKMALSQLISAGRTKDWIGLNQVWVYSDTVWTWRRHVCETVIWSVNEQQWTRDYLEFKISWDNMTREELFFKESKFIPKRYFELNQFNWLWFKFSLNPVRVCRFDLWLWRATWMATHYFVDAATKLTAFNKTLTLWSLDLLETIV